MPIPFFIRRALRQDVPDMQSLFVNTIRQINSKDYTPQQISAWASTGYHVTGWTHKFIQGQYCLCGIMQGKLVGFASLDGDAIDLMYVHQDYQGMGIAKALFDVLLLKTRENGSTVLYADVSITALPFFEHMGFEKLTENTWSIDGVTGVNWKMKKNI